MLILLSCVSPHLDYLFWLVFSVFQNKLDCATIHELPVCLSMCTQEWMAEEGRARMCPSGAVSPFVHFVLSPCLFKPNCRYLSKQAAAGSEQPSSPRSTWKYCAVGARDHHPLPQHVSLHPFPLALAQIGVELSGT